MQHLQKTIKAIIKHSENQYVAECVEISVVTQGKTLDEVVSNLKEAVALHLDGENLAEMGLTENPALVVTLNS